ncbi:hypothetical protein SUGI_0097030 [Cryptomeria japonica]|nr:hypothetical protein SUGI_0097030 [Cryptomeria japonica]
MSTFVTMEESQGSTKYDSKTHKNGVEHKSLMCQSSGMSKSYKKDRKYRYRGVCRRASGRFTAQIIDPITKHRHWLGTYDTPELAASAYDFAARAMRGTKARTNFLNLIFDSCKLTPSATRTLSGSTDFNPQFLSKPSNVHHPLSSSLSNKPSQKQDHHFFHFGGSSSKLSTNDFALPCPIPYSQSFQIPSSPTAFTLNMPMQPFLNKTTSAVPETISTTPSLPNPVFPLHHRFLASTPQSQQCSTVMQSNPFSSNGVDCSYSNSGMVGNISNQFTHTPIPTIESSLTTCSSACNNNSTLDYGFGIPKEPYSHTIPCTTIHSTTGLFNLDLQKGLYVNQNEQYCTKEMT